MKKSSTSPIKLFVGTSANGEDAHAEITYEYSLRKHCSRDIDITWMRQSRDPSSPFFGWYTSMWATPFTAFRWAVPELCNFQGRAIFTDIDMLNLYDIGELYDMDMQGKPLLARFLKDHKRHEFSVMLMDCDKICDKIPPIADMKQIPDIHQRLTRKFSGEKYTGHLDPSWNCLDGENLSIDEIKQLHFTFMNSQPWQPEWYTGTLSKHRRPELVELWERYHQEAIQQYGQPEISYEAFGKYDIIGR